MNIIESTSKQDQRRKQIYDLWKQHGSYSAVAKIMGVTPTTVRNACIKHEEIMGRINEDGCRMSERLRNVLNNEGIDKDNTADKEAFCRNIMYGRMKMPNNMGKGTLEELRIHLGIEEKPSVTHCKCCGQPLP